MAIIGAMFHNISSSYFLLWEINKKIEFIIYLKYQDLHLPNPEHAGSERDSRIKEDSHDELCIHCAYWVLQFQNSWNWNINFIK